MVPHLIGFMLLDVSLQHVYENNDQNSHTFCYYIALFAGDPLEPLLGASWGPWTSL